MLVVTEADFSDDEGHKTLAGGGGSTGNIKPIGGYINDTTSYGTLNGINGGSAIGAVGTGGSGIGTQLA